MKKIVALIMLVMMLCTAMVPIQSLAAEDKGFEKAVSTVKAKIDIPDEFTFDKNFDVYTQPDGKRIWNLRWSSKDELKGGINVRVSDDGTIYGYDRYKPYDYSNRKKLPRITREEAQKSASAFIKKVNPAIVSNIKLVEDQNLSLMQYSYYFNFVRVVNDIPYYENNVSVSVDQDTGEVQNYNYNWADDLVFPDTDKAIQLADAEKAYKEKMGLKLIYRYVYEDNKLSVFPVYITRYNESYAIDALTGEMIQLAPFYRWYDYGGAGGAAYDMQMKASYQTANEEVKLSPEEEEAAEEASKIISRDEAEKAARSFAALNLTDDYKLNYSWLSRGWPERDTFFYNLEFVQEANDTNKEYRYVNVNINAITREIKGFNTYLPYNEKDEPKYDEAASKEAVEKFLKDTYPERFSQTVYDDTRDDGRVYVDVNNDKPRTYYFTYTRYVNGIECPDNSLTVGFDAVNGKIYSFNMNWFDKAEFPAVSKSVSSEKSLKTLFDQIGLELQYKNKYDEDMYKPGYGSSQNKPEIKLVYSLKMGKPRYFDPATGIILDYNGKPYKEIKPVSYSDVTGHYAEEQIKVLAEYGIGLEGDKFRPDESITQKDFLTLLSKTIGYYYGPYIKSDSTEKDIDNLYNFMTREGIVKDGEKAPDAAVSREDSVKFIIRALKFDRVADIKGIYNCTFKDADKVNPDLIGYVTIAQGLKIVNGSNGYFNPQVELTRAQAAIIIYNYLQV